jgi:excisionase family DNA binding protein
MTRTQQDVPILDVSPAGAAKALGVSRDHIYKLIEARLIESSKSGSRVLIDWQSLLDYRESIRRSA